MTDRRELVTKRCIESRTQCEKSKDRLERSEARCERSGEQCEQSEEQCEQSREQCEQSGTQHVYHQFTIRVTGGRRDGLRKWLTNHGIETMIYYPRPVHEMPLYADYAPRCPESEAASREVLSLPIWPRITADVQRRVTTAIGSFAEPALM